MQRRGRRRRRLVAMADRDDSGIDPATIVARKLHTPPAPPARATSDGAAEARAVESFEIIRTTQRDRYDPPLDDLAAFRAIERIATGDAARFAGTDREEAKTSIPQAPFEPFDDLHALIATLPSDLEMQQHDPPLHKDSPRVEEEKRNVRVHAFVHAAKKQKDRDYHVIIGATARRDTTFMNVEISGLPKDDASPATMRIARARRAFEEYMHDDKFGLPNTGGYDFYDTPRPVTIEGALFFDVHHAGDGAGPGDATPKTDWEIHPITRIQFLSGHPDNNDAGPERATAIAESEHVAPDGERFVITRTTQRDPYDDDPTS